MSQTTAHPARAPLSTLSSAEIRRAFIEFFEKKHAHTFVPSSPCVPLDDPTLLFTNAGMNQFKPVFLGNVAPSSPLARLKRAVNSQKCIRAGGKHNDLDDVGKDTYHHTFFEMLGNWSFGDYFKAEAVAWSWELLTRVFGIPEDRLYATYFMGSPGQGLEPDNETRQLWLKYLPPGRVIPGSMKDNFWEMGDTGPCGPCTEIHVDRIGGRDAATLVNSGDPDVIEIWNNVFIQFNREEGGKLRPLPARHVDTGMGFERLVSVLQGVRSNYDSDVFARLFLEIEKLTGARPYMGRTGAADEGNIDTAYRVIADHIRTLTFAITDGATPSNEGRGYVLRRILRRAVRYGRQILGARTGFFSHLVPVVVQQMGEFFPELRKNPAHVADTIREEEESFARTLDRGIVHFDEACIAAFKKARLIPHLQMAHATVEAFKSDGAWTLAIRRPDSPEPFDAVPVSRITPQWADAHFGPSREIAADDAFKLYDTYGFPIDLTALMAEERGLRLDMAGYNALMEKARERARSGGKFAAETAGLALSGEAVAKLRHMNVEPTADVDKFHGRQIAAAVKAIWNGADFDESARASSTTQAIGVVLDATNFYAEMGGQVADTGRLTALRAGPDGATAEFRVESVHAYGGFVLHVGRLVRGELRTGDSVACDLDDARRAAVAANHTATHLLNLGLRAALGPGADQKGSLVAPDRLRFDFAAAKPVTPEELAKVESIAADQVRRDLPVHAEVRPLAQARAIKGLRAVFGEAYPDPVRVVSIGRSVADMIAETDDARAAQTSVEFCGGTHVARTGEIGAFCIVGEEAVAKGIRRITALTGIPAAAAIKTGQTLAERFKAADRLSGDALSIEAKALAMEIDQLSIPLTLKAGLRAALSALQDKVKAAAKQASAARAGEIMAQARAIADSPEYDQGSFIVTSIEAGSDREALTAALNAIRTRRPRAGVLLVSPDPDENKLTILAAVPDAIIKRGLNAGEWVRAAAAACGGKGGGKPDLAQGGGPDASRLKEVLAAAKTHAFAKIPN
ncbi:MAG: alanine--tRNA ligase [Phycisphaeraceae bacterium]|nr:alanine--tRNA ligase [Phycisphaeraceae bacterium]